jgi:hypothetical protein
MNESSGELSDVSDQMSDITEILSDVGTNESDVDADVTFKVTSLYLRRKTSYIVEKNTNTVITKV